MSKNVTWKIPHMWSGGEVWILGGGPSLAEQFGIPQDVVNGVREGGLPISTYTPYMAAIHDKHVIGVNAAFLIGDWIDMVFFGDFNFYRSYRRSLAAFPGLKVTCDREFANMGYVSENIKYLSRDRGRFFGITSNPKQVSWNNNSGAAAISVAVGAGAKRIILIGFDMRLDEDGNKHWHRAYGKKPVVNNKPGALFQRHLKGFDAIKRDAKNRGIEIINASPTSRISQFPKVNLKDLIR